MTQAIHSNESTAKGRHFLRENGLSLVLLALFLLCLLGQSLAGFLDWNEELRRHGRRTLDFVQYLGSGHFVEATFENWESEFLQMSLYVLLTVSLFQKGSSESNDPHEPADEKEHPVRADSPWPVRRGGFVRKLYEHSLSSVLGLVFVVSFLVHALGGVERLNDERSLDGLPPQALAEYVTSARFWYESFQNWQSEFLAVLAIVVLSIFLREKGSAQSKPVVAPHGLTGG
jgi:hypothetical protein